MSDNSKVTPPPICGGLRSFTCVNPPLRRSNTIWGINPAPVPVGRARLQSWDGQREQIKVSSIQDLGISGLGLVPSGAG